MRRVRTAVPAFGVALLVGTVVLAFLESFTSLYSLWASDGYRHAYLIPLISFGLLMQNRQAIARIAWTGSWWGLVLLATAIWGCALGKSVVLNVVEHVAVFLVIVGFVWAIVGDRVFKHIRFAILYLAFALPLGSGVIQPLMWITADVVTAGLQVFSVPAYREGMVLWLPGGVFEVAEACSGFNYLNAGVAVGALVAHQMFRSPVRAILYVVVVTVVFVLANGLRALTIVVVGSVSELRVLAGDHIFFGWIVFVVVMVAMYVLAVWSSDRRDEDAPNET